MADIDQYKITNLSYPENLTSSEEYGGNYVVFYINIQSESKLAKSGWADIVNDAITGINSNISSNLGLGSVLLNQAVTGAAIGAVGKMVTGYKASDSSGKLSTINSIWGAIESAAPALGGAALELAAVAAINGASGGFSQPTKRLRTAIALNMPMSFITRYGINYEEESVPFGIEAAAAAINTVGKSGLPSGSTDSMVAAASAGSFKLMGESKGILSKLSKTAPNPTTEMIFKSVETRIFSFTYRFAPKSITEANNVLSIIQQFKYHMHPEFTDEIGFLYIYPSEFDIVYYNNGVENKNIHKQTSSVLTAMDVNYNAGSVGFSTFANGMPNQIEITLSFKELAKLNKSNINQSPGSPGGY